MKLLELLLGVIAALLVALVMLWGIAGAFNFMIESGTPDCNTYTIAQYESGDVPRRCDER